MFPLIVVLQTLQMKCCLQIELEIFQVRKLHFHKQDKSFTQVSLKCIFIFIKLPLTFHFNVTVTFIVPYTDTLVVAILKLYLTSLLQGKMFNRKMKTISQILWFYLFVIVVNLIPLSMNIFFYSEFDHKNGMKKEFKTLNSITTLCMYLIVFGM